MSVQLLIVGLLIVLSVLASALAATAARCNFREWRTMRHQPVVNATDAEIRKSTEAWPWNKERWPDPGAAPDWKLPPTMCRALARHARRMDRRWTAAQTIIGVVAATVTAIEFPKLWPAARSVVEGNAALFGPHSAANSFGAAVLAPFQALVNQVVGAGWPTTVVLLVSMVSWLSVVITHDYLDRVAAYLAAARLQEEAARARRSRRTWLRWRRRRPDR